MKSIFDGKKYNENMSTSDLIDCAHCKGTGTCNLEGKSCDSCLSLIKLSKGLVSCGCCKGLGKNSLWNIQSESLTSKPIEEGLTGYTVKQEQETIRELDKRRYRVAQLAFVLGLGLVCIGIYTNNLNVLLPVASSLMTGVIGYFVGGQLGQSKKIFQDLNDQLNKSKKTS